MSAANSEDLLDALRRQFALFPAAHAVVVLVAPCESDRPPAEGRAVQVSLATLRANSHDLLVAAIRILEETQKLLLKRAFENDLRDASCIAAAMKKLPMRAEIAGEGDN